MNNGTKGWKIRLVLTIVILLLSGFAATVWAPLSSNASAVAAGGQLDGTNAGAVGAALGRSYVGALGWWASLAVLALLALIWVPYAIRVIRAVAVSAVALAFGLALAQPASAYWSQNDVAEPIGIGSNVTAFWVPTTGNTADQSSNIQKDAALYASDEVPGGVFLVPHAKLQNSVSWGFGYYVPTGRLYLVDRSPYNREWTASSATGTGSGNQGFNCQSTDGINIEADVNIAVSIAPEDAAIYLANFGTDPIKADPGDTYMQANGASDPDGLNDPEVIYASAVHAKNLTEVMDGIGHSLVGVAVCQALGSGTLVQDNTNYIAMMKTIQATAVAYLQPRGITLDFIGWGSGLNLDPTVQAALNNATIGQIEQPFIPVLQKEAVIRAIQGWAASGAHLPSSITLVDLGGDISDLLGGLAGGGAAKPK